MPQNPFDREFVREHVTPIVERAREHAAPIVERAKDVIVDPAIIWGDVIEEDTPPKDLLLRYALPLAAIKPLADLIGALIFGYGALGFRGRVGFGSAIGMALTSFILSIAVLYFMAWFANWLSPRLGGKQDFPTAFRLAAYAMTAAWVAGIFGLIPPLSILGLLGLYSIYIFYTGVRPVMGVADEQAASYTIVVFVAGIVAYLVTGSVVSYIGGMPALII